MNASATGTRVACLRRHGFGPFAALAVDAREQAQCVEVVRQTQLAQPRCTGRTRQYTDD